MVGWAMPRSPGHVFYDRLTRRPVVLLRGQAGGAFGAAGALFPHDTWWATRGIDSERGLEWRCSDTAGKPGSCAGPFILRPIFDLIAEAGLVKGEAYYNRGNA